MNFRKNMPLVVGGGVTLVLAAVLLFVLFRARSAFQEVSGQLQSSFNRLMSLQSRDPFPSPDNVAKVHERFLAQEAYFKAFYQQIQDGQIAPEAGVSRTQFPILFEKGVRKLLAKAKEVKVILPPNMAFGFDRYMAGELPEDSDVPRLTLQVKTVGELCAILLQARITELSSVQRQVFEKGLLPAPDQAQEERRGRQEPDASQSLIFPADEMTDASGLFKREHYRLVFKCSDEALWTVISQLARSKMQVVVTDLQVVNASKPARVQAKSAQPMALDQPEPEAAPLIWGQAPPPVAKPAPTAAAPEIKSREQRIVGGKEVVDVTLDVEVYSFPLVISQGEAQP